MRLRRATAGGGIAALIAATVVGAISPHSVHAVSAPWDPYFAAPTTVADYGAAGKPYGVAVGDFSGDGVPDMIVGRSTGNATGLTFANPATLADLGTGTRTFGVAAADFDGDGKVDLVVDQRSTGYLFYARGNGDGTFQAAVQMPYKLETFNASTPLVVGDVNGDTRPDIVWGAITSGADAGTVVRVSEGDVRVFLGNGDGTFVANTYARSGVTFAAGTLMARIGGTGSRVTSLAVRDVDGNGRADVVAGGIDAAPGVATANTVIRVIMSNGDGSFSLDAAPLYSHSSTDGALQASGPIYYPANASTSAWAVSSAAPGPWGLAFADFNGDGRQDLVVADRALYAYLFSGDGAGHFAEQTGFSAVTNRPYVYLGHDALRDTLQTTGVMGYTPALATADFNADGRPDLVLGLESGAQTASAGAHDGAVALDLSVPGGGYQAPTVIGNIGFEARGVSVVDLNRDGMLDIVGGSYTGKVSSILQTAVPADPDVFFLAGAGGGGFGASTPFSWRLEPGNANDLVAADVNHDGRTDLVWSATVSGADTGGTTRVNDGDVRVLYGDGAGGFSNLNSYARGATTYAAGTLLARIAPSGLDAASIAVGDVDHDGWPDVVAGGLDGAGNTIVVFIHNNGDGSFSLAPAPLVSEPAGIGSVQSPVYYPATSPAVSPWGLAVADVSGDGNPDILVLDRALYLYQFRGDGLGGFAMATGFSAVSGRPNAYLGHDGLRASVSYTGVLAIGDVNGDGRPDIAVGLQAGGQASPVLNDGAVALDLSTATAGVYKGGGVATNLGTQARGVNVLDLTGDGNADIVAGAYGGKVSVVRQLPPLDSDGDGISDYVDNAPYVANAPRLDMNTDGAVNYKDQLDNDYDTVLGNPEDPSTWVRLGDAADPDSDNDGVANAADNCPLTYNPTQADSDHDGIGDACDPLLNRDTDSDGVLDSIHSGEPMFAQAQAAAALWASGTTHFVIRIDSLEYGWQAAFSEILSDAVVQPSLSAFQAACAADYAQGADGNAAYRPDCASTDGGKGLSLSLVLIPKLDWQNPTMIAWINNRLQSQLFELAQHGTYHRDNIPVSDVATNPDIVAYGVYSESTGLSLNENYEYLRVGQDSMTGNYSDVWTQQEGATPSSPKIDWAHAVWPLITYVPPYDTSDTTARQAMAMLGYKGFSASTWEESGDLASIFSPEGSHMEQFDQFGMYHASADVQIRPPGDLSGSSWNHNQYDNYLQQNTDAGGLTTWLVEAPDWTGRDATTGNPNDTVDPGKFAAWNALLDYVKAYPGGISMTLGEVALAKGFDNAPTVANPDQADANHNGIGDVIEGSHLDMSGRVLWRGSEETVSAALHNGAGQALAGQTVTFTGDLNGDGTGETYTGTTDATGVAHVTVTPTALPGTAISVQAHWDSLNTVVADATSTFPVNTTTAISLAGNPGSGLLTQPVTVEATLTDSADSTPIAGATLHFAIGGDTADAITNASGFASTPITLTGGAGTRDLVVTADATGGRTAGRASQPFEVQRDPTGLLVDTPASTDVHVGDAITLGATLRDEQGNPVPGATLSMSFSPDQTTTVTTDATGHATWDVAVIEPVGVKPFTVEYAGDGTYMPTSDTLAYTAYAGSAMQLDAGNPTSGHVTDTVHVVAYLTDTSLDQPVAGATVTFAIGGDTATALTSAAGRADADITLGRPIGDRTLTASFAGTAGRDPASASVPFTVSIEPVVLTLDPLAPQGTLNTAYMVGATITDDEGTPLHAGNPIFFELMAASEPTNQTLTGYTDAAGHAAVTFTLIPPLGTWGVNVQFPGDTDHDWAYVHQTMTVVVGSGLTIDATTPSGGELAHTVHVSAHLVDAGDGSALAGQSVDFGIGSDTASAVTDAAGVAQADIALTGGAEMRTLIVSYDGDGVHLPVTAQQPFEVDMATTSLTLEATPPSGLIGSAQDVGATLRDDLGNALAGMPVTLSLNGQSALVSTDATGYAGTTFTLQTPSGASQVQASFAGDATYLPAGASTAYAVMASTFFGFDNGQAQVGNLTDTVHVSGFLMDLSTATMMPGSDVVLSIGSDRVTATADSGGRVSVDIPLTGSAGGRALLASYAGDAAHTPYSSSMGFTVLRDNTAMALDSVPATGNVNSAISVGGTLRDDEGNPVAGAPVTLSAGASSITVNTGSTGNASALLVLSAPLGPTTVSAQFAGDGTYVAGGASRPFTVTAASALALGAAVPGSGALTDVVHVTATLTDSSEGNAPLAGQTVSFAIGANSSSTVTDAGGAAAVDITLSGAAGARTLTATFNGAGYHLTAAASKPFQVTLHAARLVLDTPTPTAGDVTDSVTAGATLTSSDGLALAGRTVVMTLNGQTRSLTTGATGHVSTSFTLQPPSGASQITAQFAGDTTYASSQVAAAFSVNLKATVLTAPATVASASKSGKVQIQVRLTAVRGGTTAGVSGRSIGVYVPSAKNPSVYVLDTTIRTDAGGYATVTEPTPKSGTTAVQFRFAGDTSYLASQAQTVVGR